MKASTRYLFWIAVLPVLMMACANRDEKTHVDHNTKAEVDIYTCPMHPEIIRNAPGQCPICGMDLVKKESGNAAVRDIELEALLKPSNEFVVSTVPVTALLQREEEIELSVVGKVDYDLRQAGMISSRVKGRIEKLYVRYRYQPIKKGQRVLDIYSPELVTAQQNLLFLLRNDPGNASLINAAKERLILMGMTPAQVTELVRTQKPMYAVPVFSNYGGFVTDLNSSAGNSVNNMQPSATNQELATREGMYVQSGQAIFSVYNPSGAWILLDIFPEQQALIKVGNAVRVVPETAPHQNFRAKIDYIEPVFRPGAKTLSARVYFNNATLRLPIGSRVTAHIFASSKKASWLPKEAVLSLGRDRIVFLRESNGFRAHRVMTGIQVNGHIQVTGGLSASDSVASNAQFLVDNEAFIKVENK